MTSLTRWVSSPPSCRLHPPLSSCSKTGHCLRTKRKLLGSLSWRSLLMGKIEQTKLNFFVIVSLAFILSYFVSHQFLSNVLLLKSFQYAETVPVSVIFDAASWENAELIFGTAPSNSTNITQGQRISSECMQVRDRRWQCPCHAFHNSWLGSGQRLQPNILQPALFDLSIFSFRI